MIHQTLSDLRSLYIQSVVIFDEMRFALNALPETFIEFLQALIR